MQFGLQLFSFLLGGYVICGAVLSINVSDSSWPWVLKA